MGKGAAAGIVITLIVGVLIGYFVIPMMFPLQADGSRQTYFIVQNKLTYDLPQPDFETIPDLNMTLTTETGDNLVLELTCRLWLDPQSPSITVDTAFAFAIDGQKVDFNTYAWVRDTLTNDTMYFYLVEYRLVVTGLSAGIHNVSVQAKCAGNLDLAYTSMHVLSVEII